MFNVFSCFFYFVSYQIVFHFIYYFVFNYVVFDFVFVLMFVRTIKVMLFVRIISICFCFIFIFLFVLNLLVKECLYLNTMLIIRLSRIYCDFTYRFICFNMVFVVRV